VTLDVLKALPDDVVVHLAALVGVYPSIRAVCAVV
jgi:hypothetical protein